MQNRRTSMRKSDYNTRNCIHKYECKAGATAGANVLASRRNSMRKSKCKAGATARTIADA